MSIRDLFKWLQQRKCGLSRADFLSYSLIAWSQGCVKHGFVRELKPAGRWIQEVVGDRTPGSGQTPAWVKPEDDENLENALNALKFPAQPGKESGTSPAMFECMHGLSISPFQSNSLQNLFRSAGTRSVPRAGKLSFATSPPASKAQALCMCLKRHVKAC